MEYGMLELLGIKLSSLWAGFCGSSVYLVSVQRLGAFRMFTSVGASMLCAVYVSPLVAEFMKLNVRLEVGVAFIIGLTTMAIVPGLLKSASKASSDPLATIKKYRGK
jgi:hypothetical protein